MTLAFGTGHIEESDAGIPHVGLLLAGAPPVTSKPIDHADMMFNQGRTSSCVGCAFAMALYLRAAVLGSPIAVPSPLAIYAFARFVAQGSALEDRGSQPGDAVDAMAMRGLVAYDRWTLDAPVNQLPPWDVEQHAADARVRAAYGLDGTDRDAIKAAIAAGHPVAWAQRVDDAFAGYKGGVLGPQDGGNHGSHYTLIVDTFDGGAVCQNSWGASWGEPGGTLGGGFYRASWERLAQGSNFRAVDIAPSRVT